MRRILKHLAVCFILGVAAFVALDLMFPPRLDRLTPSTRVFAADGQLLHAFLTTPAATDILDPPAWRLATRPDDVDPLYLEMLLAFEDARYYDHPGVDPLAVGRATWQMVTQGRVVSGASTLTMQGARLLEPHRDRILASKIVESFRALQVTRRFTKDEALSIYLTLAPFGGNLEGVRAGSLAWFGKEPKHLTPGEAAFLVAIPRSPERLRPDVFPLRARAARNAVLARLIERGVLEVDRASEAMDEPIPTVRRALPRLAPHLSRRLAANAAPGDDIHTTIDRSLQGRLEELSRDTVRHLSPKQSVAMMAVESRTGHILASVGSPNELDTERAGAIDMTRAVRSPGSALKPLIYAMAFERGILHPLTLMNDCPTRFGSYTPSNFEDAHWGEVTASEALVHSLNVPAVMLLDRIGPMALTARLDQVGIPVRLPSGLQRPGLPIALGGLGMRLDELVALYAMIDAGGQAPFPSPVVSPASDDVPQALMTPLAAWQVADILAQSPPPRGYAHRDSQRARTIAYKTGTSYGYRDAYAVGFDGQVTIGVWVGRPDGSPSPGDFGRRTAAPILFQAFERLPPSKSPTHRIALEAQAGITRNADLPFALRHFRNNQGGSQARATPLPDTAVLSRSADYPALVFPPDGSVLECSDGRSPITLSARGGQRPLLWLVNGKPLSTPAHARQVFWLPDGPGAVQITVVDALGRSASADVWLKLPSDD